MFEKSLSVRPTQFKPKLEIKNYFVRHKGDFYGQMLAQSVCSWSPVAHGRTVCASWQPNVRWSLEFPRGRLHRGAQDGQSVNNEPWLIALAAALLALGKGRSQTDAECESASQRSL